jgi:aspartate/methionine/tyrosine aminotransferase
MADRTVTISGLSKTFSVTGWRLGYCVSPTAVTSGIRKAHDFLTVGAPHPLQVAGATALGFNDAYYAKLRNDYHRRRELFLPYLQKAGFECSSPEGAYYVMTDITGLGGTNDVEFVKRMIETIGVAAPTVVSFTVLPAVARLPSASKGAHSCRCAGSVSASQTFSGEWRNSLTRTSVHFSPSFCTCAPLAGPGA